MLTGAPVADRFKLSAETGKQTCSITRVTSRVARALRQSAARRVPWRTVLSSSRSVARSAGKASLIRVRIGTCRRIVCIALHDTVACAHPIST